MQKSITIKPDPFSGFRPVNTKIGRLLLKRIWLPNIVYEALPLIYVCSGLVALAAALFLPGWTWILPWAVIFGLATLHLGLSIAALRHRFRRMLNNTHLKTRFHAE